MRVASKTKKTALQQIVANFMSDEEDGEGSQESVWVVKSPLWHSPQLSSLLKRLQEKIDNQPSAFSSSHPQNTRVEGEPSTRSPPTSSPAWALLPGYRQSPKRSPSQNRIPPSSVPTTLQWWWKWWGTLAYVGHQPCHNPKEAKQMATVSVGLNYCLSVLYLHNLNVLPSVFNSVDLTEW